MVLNIIIFNNHGIGQKYYEREKSHLSWYLRFLSISPLRGTEYNYGKKSRDWLESIGRIVVRI